MTVECRHLTDDAQWRAWRAYVDRLGDPARTPFAEQWARFAAIYADRPPALGPPPAWVPDAPRRARSNLARFMAERGVTSYAGLHAWSVSERAAFWEAVIERLGIVFRRRPRTVLDLAGGPTQPRWLPDAELSCVDSCFAAPRDAVAIVSGGEGDDRLETTTYGELAEQVARCARGLRAAGFRPGEGIALYMPMTVACVVAYLGTIRAGCRVISIADSFTADEIARRLTIAGARGIVTVESFMRGGKSIALYDTVRAAGAPRAIVIPADGDAATARGAAAVTGGGAPAVTGRGAIRAGALRAMLRDGDLLWDDVMQGAQDDALPDGEVDVAAPPDTATNILFSSGTTGDPKAIPWTHLTPIKCAMDGHFHHDIQPGDVVAWPTNIGWMMGPWLIFASLMNGAAMALYEGAPHGRGFARFVERAGVTMLGVVPSLVRAWREGGACRDADWSRVRVLSSTGEPSSREDYLWLMSRAHYRAPVIEYCGGTEIGGGYVTGTVLEAASPATFTTPALGLDMVILDESGRPAAPGTMGEVFLVPPSIGLSQTLLNMDHDAVYHADCPPGPDGEVLRRHGDQMEPLARGYLRAHGRADDTMNLGGIKVSSLELEAVIESHEAIVESAAIAHRPDGEGAARLVVFAVLRDATADGPDGGSDTSRATLVRELNALLATRLNPLFKIRDLVAVEVLPRTASNKLMRRTLRARYAGRPGAAD